MANVVRDPQEHPDAILPDLSRPDPLVSPNGMWGVNVAMDLVASMCAILDPVFVPEEE